MKSKLKFAVIFVFAVMLALVGGADAAARFYVKVGGTGDGKGGWENAGGDLERIIHRNIYDGDDVEIWVAKGEYIAQENTNTFVDLKTGTKLYGGFNGTEKSLEERDWKTNVTILNGNKKAIHVVRSREEATPENTIIDGFTITGGNARSQSGPGENEGAGMYNDDGSPMIANCIFIGNAAGNGGGIYNRKASPVITNCTFLENWGSRGGGIHNNDSSPEITNCTFLKNTGDNGGGIFNYNDSEPKITDCVFIENKAGKVGGGIANYRSAAAVIANCTFSKNSGAGGGIYNLECSPTITNCIFSENNGSDSGGAYNKRASPTFVNCIFSGNTGIDSGGAYNESASPTFVNCVFSGNTGIDSGAMYNIKSHPTIINCTFSGNTTDNHGGGIRNALISSPTIINCTFSGNAAKKTGGGMTNFDDSSPLIVNTIFWGNTAEAKAPNGAEIYQSKKALILKNCVINISGVHISKEATIDNTNSVEADPKLVPTTNASGVFIYKLAAGSSAIDKGLAVGTAISDNAKVPDKDQLGTARPQGGGVDIGAFEVSR